MFFAQMQGHDDGGFPSKVINCIALHNFINSNKGGSGGAGQRGRLMTFNYFEPLKSGLGYDFELKRSFDRIYESWQCFPYPERAFSSTRKPGWALQGLPTWAYNALLYYFVLLPLTVGGSCCGACSKRGIPETFTKKWGK